MSVQTITATIYRLYLVTFSYGEEGERTKEAGYFSSKDDANKIASLKRGCWGSSGDVREMDFKTEGELPSYWITAKEWARNNLTVAEYEELNFR